VLLSVLGVSPTDVWGACFGLASWGVRSQDTSQSEGAPRQGFAAQPRTLHSYLRMCIIVLARWVRGRGVLRGESGVSLTDVCGGLVLAQGVGACRHH
jgi:hypothetical protein